MSAPTSRGSRGCSCHMLVALRPIKRSVIRSLPTVTKASALALALKSSDSQQIDRTHDGGGRQVDPNCHAILLPSSVVAYPRTTEAPLSAKCHFCTRFGVGPIGARDNDGH